MTKDRLQYLLDSRQAERLSAAESTELDDFLLDDANQEFVNDVLVDMMIAVTADTTYDARRFNPLLEDVVRADLASSGEAPANVLHSRRFRWQWAACAAAVVLLVGLALAYLPARRPQQPQQAAAGSPAKTRDSILPGSTHPQLTLADGSIISLDNGAGNLLARQGNTSIQRLPSGEIVYMSATGVQPEQFNVLTVPRGSKLVDLVLSDGSHVWLNAASSIRYPVAFGGAERLVEVSGEAYFEVTHAPERPFIVHQKDGDLNIRVLGTHFNVNAYRDEPAVKVTLLEGAVKLSQQNQEALLQPGQQGAAKNRNITVNSNTDLDEVMAWKNGRFQFGEKATIETIMRQISRWYDVDVKYEGSVRIHFGGSISRHVTVSEVLDKLALTGAVSFRLENNTIIVTPKN